MENAEAAVESLRNDIWQCAYRIATLSSASISTRRWEIKFLRAVHKRLDAAIVERDRLRATATIAREEAVAVLKDRGLVEKFDSTFPMPQPCTFKRKRRK